MGPTRSMWIGLSWVGLDSCNELGWVELDSCDGLGLIGLDFF